MPLYCCLKWTFFEVILFDLLSSINLFSNRNFPKALVTVIDLLSGQRIRLSKGDILQTMALYQCPGCGRTYQVYWGFSWKIFSDVKNISGHVRQVRVSAAFSALHSAIGNRTGGLQEGRQVRVAHLGHARREDHLEHHQSWYSCFCQLSSWLSGGMKNFNWKWTV